MVARFNLYKIEDRLQIINFGKIFNVRNVLHVSAYTAIIRYPFCQRTERVNAYKMLIIRNEASIFHGHIHLVVGSVPAEIFGIHFFY
jgi:hypothetical protein